jgi:diguanylate cyclase (GGDEF)-like protein
MLLISNRFRFFCLLGLILLALLTSTLVFAQQFDMVVKDRAKEEHTISVLAQGHRLLEDLEMAETGQRGFLLTGNERYLKPYFLGMQDANAAITALRTAVKDDQQTLQIVDDIDREKDLKLVELERTIILKKDGRDKDAIGVVKTDLGQNYMDDIRADVNLLMVQWRKLRTDAYTDAQRRITFTLIAFAGMGFVIITILAWSIWTQRNAYEEIQAHVEHLDHQATHDPLTDLYNRRKLLSDLDGLADLTDTTVGLIYIDIDGFKSVNDKMGHEVGDQLLRKLANAFKKITRSSDTLARIGGDEFVFLIPDYQNDEMLIEIAKRIIKSVEVISKAEYNGLVNASLGIATYQSRVSSVHDLLTAADGAMYKSKRSGRGRYHFSDT